MDKELEARLKALEENAGKVAGLQKQLDEANKNLVTVGERLALAEKTIDNINKAISRPTGSADVRSYIQDVVRPILEKWHFGDVQQLESAREAKANDDAAKVLKAAPSA